MRARLGYMALILAALTLGGCDPESDAAYQRGKSDGEASMMERVRSQAEQIKQLQSRQRQAGLDAACSTSLICSLSHRIAGIAPPSKDAQPDPDHFNFYITALRLIDTLLIVLLVIAVGMIWLLLQAFRNRLQLTQLKAQIKDSRNTHETLLGDIAELQGQRLTIEQARRLASQCLQSALDSLIHRQDAIEAQKAAKMRLEREILTARKALAQLTSPGKRQPLPDSASPQATARSIFDPKSTD